jgi:hypothetical protein
MSNSKWPWTGFRPAPKLPKNLCGAYSLVHENTGKFYIGSTSNVCGCLQAQLAELQARKHKNKRLQACFDADPEFRVSFILMGDRKNEADLVDKCWRGEQELLAERSNHSLMLSIGTDAGALTAKQRKRIAAELKEKYKTA